MMGPRSMGAGTLAARGQQPAENDRDRDHDPYDTLNPYGGIELDFAHEPQAAPSQNQAQVQLTPAQQLIERYERLSSPPPSATPHTPPHAHRDGRGGGHAHAHAHAHGQGQGREGMAREKSTKKRQYMYDYRTAGAGGASVVHHANQDNSALATPDYANPNPNPNGNSKRGAGHLKKDRSPIRQSLKNLFSVFKKGAGGLTLSKRGKGDDVRDGCASEEGLRMNTGSQKLAGNLTVAAGKAGPSRPPRKKMTGSLLYLCTTPSHPHTPDIPGQLAWSTCSVTLEESKLVVSSFTGDLELYVHEIALARCSDIRSLGAGQLSGEGARLLEEMGPEGEKLRVFEMVFSDGRERERFAAKSVRERAGWISAIWDAILPNQDVCNQGAGENTKEVVNSTSNQNDSKRRPIESPTPTPLPKLSSLLKPSYSDRSLPALPPKSPHTADPQSNHPDKSSHSVLPLNLPTIAPLVTPKKQPNLHIDLSHLAGPISPPSIYPPTVNHSPGGTSHNEVVISPSIYPPTTARPVSTFVGSPISPNSAFSASASGAGGGGGTGAGTGTGSAPNSPSIRNLSQLSVVRQRLAQIQRNHSQISRESRYSGVTTPTSTAHLRAAARSSGTTPSTSPISPVGSGWSKSEAIFYGRGGKSRKEEDGDGRVSSPFSRRDANGQAAASGKRGLEEKPEEETGPHGGSNGKTRPRANSHRESLPSATTPTKSKTVEGASKEDIRKLSREIGGIKNVLGGESGCSTVHEMVLNLEQRMRGEKKDLREIKDELKVLGERVSEAIATNVNVAARVEAVNASALAAAAAAAATVGPSATQTSNVTSEVSRKDDQAIIQALNEVKDRLAVEFPALAGKIQEVKDAQEKEEKERERENKVTTLSNVAPSASSSSSPMRSEDAAKAEADHKMLLDKLDEIRSLCQPPPPGTLPVAKAGNDEDSNLTETLAKILASVKEDSNKQTLLSQQQGDSVRYLNELNTWLEAFVNNGTSQIQGISNNIERLCNEIGCSTSNTQVAGAAGNKPQGPQPNLVNDIRQLVAGMKARDQNFAALQAAVHSLLEVLTASQTQKGADSQAIAGLMDRQRHDQEAMFRAFTNEISGEIKGERLRFVDAMKEATAINVQLHVEQFKQELSREVMSMTEEVGRLHREKQLVENQISDLFSFYSKHKQAEMPLQVIQTNTGMSMRHIAQEAPRPNIPRSTRQRALPTYPRQQ